MKKTLLSLALMLVALSPVSAQRVANGMQKVNVKELQKTLNKNDVSFLAVPEKVDGIIPTQEVAKVKKPKTIARLPRRDVAVTDTVQYFAIAQSFHKDYTFIYEGGDTYSYNIGLAINGTKATITNLFDMYNQSATEWARSYDYPVDGTYDAAAKTITIPTTVNGIVCGNYGGYYDTYLLAGNVSTSGTIDPAESLVFDVTTNDAGNITTLTARTNFAVKHEFGTIRVYKSFKANLPVEGVANLKTFTESVDFGEDFVNNKVEKTVVLYNTGGSDAEFALEIEAEDDAFTSTMTTGVVPARSSLSLPVTFCASKAGSYEGIATLTYDNGEDESTLVFDLAGTAKVYPDYSAAFKTDKFDVTTNIEFPFEMTTLEDGTQVAMSGTHGKYGSSWLRLDFVVPEGKFATVSWKGISNNVSNWYQNAGGYFVDTLEGVKASWTGANEDMSGSWEFAPGAHFIRFQYDGQAYTGLEDNHLYVYDIDYKESDLLKDAAEVLTPEVSLGNDVLTAGGSCTKTGVITLKNKGENNLVIKKVTADNADFTADISGLKAVSTMEVVSIPVTMETKTVGEKSATYTIETSAGTFTAVVKASIIAMPDFGSLVKEGAEYITSWEVNPDAPFIIKDGKAVNKNAGDNSVNETAWFRMNLNIPEGKLAYVSWKGRSYGRPIDEVNYSHLYSSYLALEMTHPTTSGTTAAYGSDIDVSSSTLEADESWADFLACVPGTHSYRWGWFHNGDGTVPEGDCAEISDIRIHVIDFKDEGVELETPEVKFDTTYVGYNRYTTAKITLRNTGSKALTVEEIPANDPFYGIETTEIAQFNKTINVTLWFYPEQEGEFNGDLTLKTSAGDVVVKCSGVALDAEKEGFVLLGDFEDHAYGWSTVDPDGDGETWNLGSNLWGDQPQYCHSGKECLASISYSYNLGAVTPDNWTISPVITIPEDGAQLSYYVAAFSPKRFEETYSMYVQPYDENTFTIEDVAKTEPLIKETLKEENGAEDGWSYRAFDLAKYAGKKVVICFRHHDCNGQYILRLDDVNVKRYNTNGISNLTKNVPGNSVRYFSVDGRQTNSLHKGINIVRSQKEDGTVVVRKVLR